MASQQFSEFLSNFDTGIARPNRYRVQFKLPKGVTSSSQFVDSLSKSGSISTTDSNYNSTGNVNVKCFSMQFPQRTVLTSEKLQNSGPFRVPYSGSSYDSISFGFYADNNLDTRKYFDIWQNAVLNVRSNTMNFYDEFVSPVYMYALDNAGNDIYGIRLEEAYPTQLSGMQYSYSQNNSYTEVFVNIQYRRQADLQTLAGRSS